MIGYLCAIVHRRAGTEASPPVLVLGNMCLETKMWGGVFGVGRGAGMREGAGGWGPGVWGLGLEFQDLEGRAFGGRI